MICNLKLHTRVDSIKIVSLPFPRNFVERIRQNHGISRVCVDLFIPDALVRKDP